MKVLVTGASGFIGTRLCQALLDRKWQVIGLGRRGVPSSLRNNVLLQWIQIDLSRESLDKDTVNGVDIVFHLAAQIKSDASNQESDFLDNEVISTKVFRACAGRIKSIIHASTQMVYGDPNSLSVDESYPLNPHGNAYGVSKLHCENWLKHFQKHHNFEATVFRFVGFVEGADSAIHHFIRCARENRPIEVFSMGKICRDYLAVEDAISALLAAASVPCTAERFRIYNIGCGEAVSTLELAQIIRDEMDSQSKIFPMATPAPRANFVYRTNKAREELGFSPMPLLQAVKKHLRDFLEKTHV